LGEDVDGRAVEETAAGFSDWAGEEFFEAISEEGGEVLIHSACLVFGAGEDSDLAIGFEDAIEEGGDGCEVGFAAAAIGPDDAVGVCGFRTGEVAIEGIHKIIEGAVVVRADLLSGDVDTEEDLDIVFQVLSGRGPCPAKGFVELIRTNNLWM
jgi:hypothetical protein